MRFDNDTFRLSVRELVEFIYRSGDINSRRGVKREQSMLAGTRIHQKIQKRQPAIYRAEVPLSINVNVEPDLECSYNILIEGRADGIYEEDGLPAIDEIKGVYKKLELITEPEQVHLAQAICYAYIDGCDTDSDYVIRMTYVNLDTEEEKYFYKTYTRSEICEWFEKTIEEYKKWCTFLWKHRKYRNESIESLQFPYEYRKGQRALVVTAYKFLKEKKTLYLQASTGIGKTLSTLYPAVRNMGEGAAEKIFYLTAKTITASVAREAISILQESGFQGSWINLTAKEKLCILEEMNCNPEDCPYAKGHMDRVNEAVYDLITSKNSITRDDIVEYAAKHRVCPFEMSLDVTYWVDLIICDYNYAFDPNVRLQRFFGDGSHCDALFLIDEAHNMVDRAREMVSATIYKDSFLKAKKIIEPYSKRMKNAIEGCNRELLALKRECDEFTEYQSPSVFNKLFDKLDRLMEEFSRFYENNPQFYDKEISDFFFMCRDFIYIREYIEKGYIFYGKLPASGDYSATLFCVDPSDHISRCLEQVNGSVFFSATLLPIDYYRSLLTGEQTDNAIYAESPFDKSKRLLLIGNDVTSKYTMRNQAMYDRISSYIRIVTSAKKGHYIVFFPSYAYMKMVYDNMPDFHDNILMQEQNMTESMREEFLNTFENEKDDTLVGFCVLGGIFSEGIDLKGTALIGVIIIGCGLPGVSPERNSLKDYFSRNSQDGFAYAYLYPGMGRVLQAAGRLIRTDDDEGVILLLDDRFGNSQYRRMFPREWTDVRYTNALRVLDDINEFWEKQRKKE